MQAVLAYTCFLYSANTAGHIQTSDQVLRATEGQRWSGRGRWWSHFNGRSECFYFYSFIFFRLLLSDIMGQNWETIGSKACRVVSDRKTGACYEMRRVYDSSTFIKTCCCDLKYRFFKLNFIFQWTDMLHNPASGNLKAV